MIACKICIAKYGLNLGDNGKIFETDKELYEHLENFHGRIVMRSGETEEEAVKRCEEKGIVPDRNKCQCEECKILRKTLLRKILYHERAR